MNIVIVGAGEVGRHLAEKLSGQQHHICVIDASETLVGEMQERLDSHVVCGNGTSVAALADAKIGDCDLLLALTSDANTNLVAASLGKSLGARRTIARVHGRVQREEWLFDFKAHFHIDYLFSTERLAAVELAKFVRNPERLTVEEIARGRIELQQTVVAASSRAVDRPLQELKLPPRVRVALIQREDIFLIPTGRDALRAGDVVTLFGEPNRLSDVLPLLDPDARREGETSVVIFGGGEYGFALAQMLEGRRYRVRILERDPKLCATLAATLQRTVVINGDATSLPQLKEEQVGQADFFIATSRDDEDNVMTCLQAKGLGARYALSLIHKADYADVISRYSDQLGILGAVSPREATGRDLMRFITSDKFHLRMTLAGGTQVLECPVHRSSGVAGRKVSEVHWPEGSGLVALLHENQALVPVGEDVIQPGDTVYGLVSEAARKPFLRLLEA
jgi:trk system potassium uptake protein